MKHKPLPPIHHFYNRLLKNAVIAFLLIILSLSIGVMGYMYFAGLNFTDAVLNASMILGGMGPVDTLKNDGAKYFASAYAIFSGVSFLSITGVLTAPVIHRAFHKFHLDITEDDKQK